MDLPNFNPPGARTSPRPSHRPGGNVKDALVPACYAQVYCFSAYCNTITCPTVGLLLFFQKIIGYLLQAGMLSSHFALSTHL